MQTREPPVSRVLVCVVCQVGPFVFTFRFLLLVRSVNSSLLSPPHSLVSLTCPLPFHRGVSHFAMDRPNWQPVARTRVLLSEANTRSPTALYMLPSIP